MEGGGRGHLSLSLSRHLKNPLFGVGGAGGGEGG